MKVHVALHPAITSSGSHWKRSARVPVNETIRIDIALSLDEDSSEKAAQAIENISGPNSASFGQHWSSKQVSELFALPKEGIRELAKWLTSSGVPRSKLRLSPDRAYLSFDVTVSNAESLPGAKFRRYSSGSANQTASKVYSLPHGLAKYVDFVLPAPGREPGNSAPTSSSVRFKDGLNTRATTRKVDCFKYMTPQCLRALYNIDEDDAQPAHPNISLGVFTPAWSTWLADDRDRFFADFAPDLVGHRPKIIPINGGYRQEEYKIASFNLEPNLDYQYSMALAAQVPVTNIQVGDKFLMGNLNTMLGAFDEHYYNTALDPQFDPIYPDLQPGGYNSSDCGIYQPLRVIAIAYAWNEASFSDKYIHRQRLEFLKLGQQGVTVVTGSGDRGPADQLGYCIGPATGNATVEGGYFSSVFPASCP
ncbi:Tripeptidyl-peptidase SED1 [Penicillium canescens]|nr:Tripeptidyl-peptidase SED1 [Penicillium canescens]KAJ6154057.1 Tripeptidyl-peptidase SED1 [Penicillium canescens]